jgi:hypothetical protein
LTAFVAEVVVAVVVTYVVYRLAWRGRVRVRDLPARFVARFALLAVPMAVVGMTILQVLPPDGRSFTDALASAGIRTAVYTAAAIGLWAFARIRYVTGTRRRP